MSDASQVLYYRQSPVDDYLVFAPPERALFVDQIQRAIEESKTWGEFRKRMPVGEYEALYEDQFSLDPEEIAEDESVREPGDDEPFTSEAVPGFSDGDYPPWVAQEQQLHLPRQVLREFGTLDSSVINGPYWQLDSKRTALIVERLESLGYKVERREDLQFW